jgi:histidinol-phosphate aminotransferase
MPTSPRLNPSRRSFLRYAGMAAAAVPIMSEALLARPAAAQMIPPEPRLSHAGLPGTSPRLVMIDANENPLGPCEAALGAIATSAASGGRYDANGVYQDLYALISEKLDMPADHFAVYAGSSEPLHFTILAFTSPTRPFIIADPSYEAGMWAAAAAGAKIEKWPLTPTYAHDVKAMVASSPEAGVIYICNPNNPTGTTTPREDILWANANKPKGTVLLIDEAYIHLSNEPTCLDLVRKGEDVIVLRTFSKVYGLAGIRCGIAFGRPDLLKKLQRYGMNPLPVTGLAAAAASLQDATLVETRRKIIADTRNSTFAWLTAKGYKFIPSSSNCFMIDTGRPGKDVITAMQQRNVYIGRTWPIWPNYVRITVGTPQDMTAFQNAFESVMSTA